MSKISYKASAPRPLRLGELLRQLREQAGLPLREVAEAADMDLTHLQKIELGHRVPTEEQAAELAKFFQLENHEIQARRLAEKWRQDNAENPAAHEALSMLAEEAGIYKTGEPRRKNSRKGGQ